MKLKLIIKKQSQVIQEKVIQSFPCSIGRDMTCDVILEAPHISRFHAEIQMNDHQWLLVRKTDSGKLLFDGAQVEKLVLEPPTSFEIPPYAFSLEPVMEEVKPLEMSKSFQPTEVLITPEFPIALDTLETSSLDDKTKISTQGPKAKIIILKGTSPHQSYDIVGHDITIGRDAACDIVIEDEKASREHAHIILKQDHFILKDMGSSNGTSLNNHRVEKESRLASGDQFQIGHTVLQFALFDENIFALTPSSSQSSDGTETTVSPQWEVEVPSYASPKSGFYQRHKKMIFASLTLVVLSLVWLTLVQKPPARQMAGTPEKEPPSSQKTPVEDPELAKLLKVDQEYVLAKMTEAKNFFKNRKYHQADVALQEIFAILPTYRPAKALGQTIEYTLKLQQEEEQKRVFLLEEKKLEEEIKYHLSLAQDYFSRGEWQKAIEAYDNILVLKPDYKEALTQKAQAEAKLTKPSEPKIRRSTASQDRNKEAEKLLAQGSQESQSGHPLEALKTWRRVLKLEAIQPEYYSKADQYIQHVKGQLEAKYLPLITQAHAMIEAKEYVEAEKILKAILQEYPTHIEAQEALEKVKNSLHQLARREFTEAIIEENVGRLDAAVKKYKWIVERIPASDEYHQKAQQKLKKYE